MISLFLEDPNNLDVFFFFLELYKDIQILLCLFLYVLTPHNSKQLIHEMCQLSSVAFSSRPSPESSCGALLYWTSQCVVMYG